MDCKWECYTAGSRITKNIVRSLLKDYKKKNECTKKLRLVVPPDVMADKINIFSKYLWFNNRLKSKRFFFSFSVILVFFIFSLAW